VRRAEEQALAPHCCCARRPRLSLLPKIGLQAAHLRVALPPALAARARARAHRALCPCELALPLAGALLPPPEAASSSGSGSSSCGPSSTGRALSTRAPRAPRTPASAPGAAGPGGAQRPPSRRLGRSGYLETTSGVAPAGSPLLAALRGAGPQPEEAEADAGAPGGRGRKPARAGMGRDDLAAYLGAPLEEKDAAVLDKLVGVMTKDGKKGRAYRILLDAMHVMRRHLAAAPGAAPAAGGAPAAAGAPAAPAAAPAAAAAPAKPPAKA